MNDNSDFNNAIADAIAKAVQPLNDKLDAILSSTKQNPASQAQRKPSDLLPEAYDFKAMAQRLQQRGKC